jgi:alcohol dehydrogenase YqhD (iron-dependent ADH family)
MSESQKLDAAEVQQMVDWINKKRLTNRNSSKKYYERNFKLSDNMTEEQKQIVNDNIKKRREYFHSKYMANRTAVIERVKQSRARAKLDNKNEDTQEQ